MRCARAVIAVACALLSALILVRRAIPAAAAAETADTTARAIVDLVLPTDNDALFRGGGPQFYQYIERDYNGVKSTPWEGGQYGFVRDPMQTAAGLIYTRFHEGIDIRPVHREEKGEPLDEVRTIAEGKVVYTNRVPGHSDYGNYVVIQHRWDGCSYYSLYAHLKAVAVKPGQIVQQGEAIGLLGYTGKAINLARAHLHLELNLMLSREFESWYDTFNKDEPNYHGIYNGINLKGLDIARLYLALRRNPSLNIPEFLADEEIFYKVLLPKSSHFELPKLYPWMLRGSRTAGARSWEISFARSGLPLQIEPSTRRVNKPELSYVQTRSADASRLTQGQVIGRGAKAHLTKDGQDFMRLLVWPD
jgi:murein DD-endopeptidase MepM/ murein hydrolase activator NlpD